MKFALCGAGRVGTSLVGSLRNTDWEFIGYYSRDYPDFVSKEEKILKPEDLAYKDLLVILALPDDSIRSVSQRLPEGLTIGHTSGSLDHTEIVSPAPSGRFSIHPIRSVSELNMNLEECFWGIEGDSGGIKAAEKIVKALKGYPVHIKTDKKPLYHIASVIATNLILSLLSWADRIFNECSDVKVSDEIIPRMVESVIKGIREDGYRGSLTGPVERGDCRTIERDLTSLKENFPELLPSVVELMRLNLNIAKEKGLDNKNVNIINSIISGYSEH